MMSLVLNLDPPFCTDIFSQFLVLCKYCENKLVNSTMTKYETLG